MKPSTPIEFTLLYDGLCPICQKEVAWLSRWNKRGCLAFVDINNDDFHAETYGKTFAELMAEIHGVLPDGTLLKGVPVFRATYRAVGLGWLMAPTAWPVLSSLFVWLYRLFAKHRLRMGSWFSGSRCTDGSCAIGKDD
jgi:predicted DCC family thiol-disulfide oxidoreductase YuxK